MTEHTRNDGAGMVAAVMRRTDAMLFSPIVKGEIELQYAVGTIGPATKCQYPTDAGPCGAPAVPDYSYCADHMARCYNGIPGRRKPGNEKAFTGRWG